MSPATTPLNFCHPAVDNFQQVKWAIENLMAEDMIRTIHEEAPLDAPKLKILVRGIRPRVGARANPREGEPMDYVLVLADIIQANDPKSIPKHALRTAR